MASGMPIFPTSWSSALLHEGLEMGFDVGPVAVSPGFFEFEGKLSKGLRPDAPRGALYGMRRDGEVLGILALKHSLEGRHPFLDV